MIVWSLCACCQSQICVKYLQFVNKVCRSSKVCLFNTKVMRRLSAGLESSVTEECSNVWIWICYCFINNNYQDHTIATQWCPIKCQVQGIAHIHIQQHSKAMGTNATSQALKIPELYNSTLTVSHKHDIHFNLILIRWADLSRAISQQFNWLDAILWSGSDFFFFFKLNNLSFKNIIIFEQCI